MDYKTYITESRFCECDYTKLQITGPVRQLRLLHAAIGLSTEMLELLEANEGRRMNDALLELGDICWFAATICDELGHVPTASRTPIKLATLSQWIEAVASTVKAHIYYGRALPADFARSAGAVLDAAASIGTISLDRDPLAANLAKLRVRYADKFEASRANVRNTAAEATAAVAP